MLNTPVIMFAYNRPSTTMRVINALRNQTVIPKQLIVYIDNIKNIEDADKYNRVIKCLESIRWTKVEICKRKENFGCAKNIITGLNQIFLNYENAIIVEDDVLVAPKFYESLCKLLNHYKNSKHVFSVGGYPSILPGSLKSEETDIFMSPRFSSWGWGTWKDRWKTLNLLEWRNPFKKIDDIPLIAGDDIRTMSIGVSQNPDFYWDIKIALSCLLKMNIHALTKYYLVNNIGLDSGDHPNLSIKIDDFSKKFNPIEDRVPELLPSPVLHPSSEKIHQEYINSVSKYNYEKSKNLLFNLQKISAIIRSVLDNKQSY